MIGEKVQVGPDTIIGPHVVLDGYTEIGARNQIFPGAAIFFSVLAYNVLGGALRDAIDPKLRKAAH